MKKRLKADSVDELFEIVKAIQNGEEPEAYAKRKAAEEAAAEAAAKKAAREKAAAKKKKRTADDASAAVRREDQKNPVSEKTQKRRAERRGGAVSGSGRAAEPAPVSHKASRDLAGTQAEIKKRTAKGTLAEEEDDEAFARLLDEESDESFSNSAKKLAGRLKSAGSFLKTGVQTGVQEGRRRIDNWKADVFEEEDSEEEEVGSEEPSVKTAEKSESDMRGDSSSGSGKRKVVHTARDEEVPSASVGARETPRYQAGEMREIRPDALQSASGDSKRASTEPSLSAAVGTQERLDGAEKTPVHGKLSETEHISPGKTQRRYGAKSISEEAEKVGQRILRSLHMEAEGTSPEKSGGASSQAAAETKEKQKAAQATKKAGGRTHSENTETDMESIDLDTVQILDRILDGAGAQHPAIPEEDVSARSTSRQNVRTTSRLDGVGVEGGVMPQSGRPDLVSGEKNVGSVAPIVDGTQAKVMSADTETVPGATVAGSAESAQAVGGAGSTESVQAAGGTGSTESVQAAGGTGSAESVQAAGGTGSAESAKTSGGAGSTESAGTVGGAGSTESAAVTGGAEGAVPGQSAADAGNTEPVQKTSEAGNAGDSQMATPEASAAGRKIDDTSTRTARLSDFQETPHTPDVKSMLRQRLHALEEKGFGKKQQTIAGIGAVAALLVLVLIVCAVSGTIRRQAKQKYVTADEGLTILVDNQPDTWCNSCELELKIKVKSGTISSIEIDGTAYETDTKGRVTVLVESALVDVTVVTENDTLTAKIEIPKLDADAPVLSVDKSQGEITVTAADARSGLAGIWYAAVEDDDWLQLPIYQQYSEPIAYEEGRTYYFYACDEAGNSSTPLVTNMVEAESAALSDTELTLLVGETASLELAVTPSNAYLTNVTFESSNTDVVTVTSAGLVTAVAEGGALIRVSADNIETITCTVTVETEQTVTVSAIGDCTLGTYAGLTYTTNFNTYYSSYGTSYFFENVRDILENDDVTFANLEGPLTDETTAVEKEFAFKGDPSYTSILLDGSIEVVTLANNHSSDYGAQSLADTKENLTAAGIDYCIGDTIAYQEVSGVKVAFIGIYELASGMDCESQVRETIAEAQSEGAQLIIVAFHWGTEKSNTPDETQQALAHIAIDCGADLVVGHHPHVLQGIEKYNGKYIVYSLGNFCFGGNTNPSDKDTMIFRQTFTITADGVTVDDAIEIIPCTISSTSSYNDYRPTPATGEDADAIMERINEYSAAFGDITYVASDGL